jgi:hypothetical protein
MTIELLSMDHPVIAVRDMPQSHAVYESLGFTIPPRGSHLEWGTGNWCIMFPNDYLELRGIVDGNRYTHNLDKFIDSRGEGLMGIAFTPAVSSEVSFEKAKAAGLNPTGLKSLTRRFELPEGDAFPKFHIAYLNEAEIPELLTTVVCQHLTPDIIRRPVWLDHANGTTGVASLSGVSTDLERLHSRLTPMVGEAALKLGSGRLTVTLPRGGVVEFLSPETARAENKAIEGAPLPYLSTLTLDVSDLQKTRDVLNKNSVPYTSEARAIRVDQANGCGVNIFFQEP